jgi:hypothetical protein
VQHLRQGQVHSQLAGAHFNQHLRGGAHHGARKYQKE